MARDNYGYGNWSAPYWFIGPEQGMAREENNDLKCRVGAWRHFGSRELDDCRKFHLKIKETRWHGDNAILQPTWNKLLLALFAFHGCPTEDKKSRIKYQKEKWGHESDETCVIELSELAARSLKEKRNRESFLLQRIDYIRGRMLDCKPRLVILYGKTSGCLKAW
jgi:putative addiction module component (TIGR02574 family)